jgi:hypothetical protein
MVLIHLKQPDGDEFYFEAPSADLIDVVATELATVHNMRLKARHALTAIFLSARSLPQHVLSLVHP